MNSYCAEFSYIIIYILSLAAENVCATYRLYGVPFDQWIRPV